MLSSSPDLPDLKSLINRNPLGSLREGNTVEPRLNHATIPSITTTTGLLRVAPEAVPNVTDTIDESRSPLSKDPSNSEVIPTHKTSAPKRVAKEVIVLSSDGTTTNDDDDLNNGESDSVYRSHSFRSSDQGEPIEDEPREKVEDPAASANPDEILITAVERRAEPKTQRKKVTGFKTVGKNFTSDPAAWEKSAKAQFLEPVNLELAVQRRMEWTPPRPDRTAEERDAADSSLETTHTEERPKTVKTNDVFKSLHDVFGHRGFDDVKFNVGTKQAQGSALVKRKAIEMVSLNERSTLVDEGRQPSPVKEKAPKKKPRTITELATEAYATKLPEVSEESRKEDWIQKCFGAAEVEGDENPVIPKNLAVKGQEKTATVSKKKKKKVRPKQSVLLSPRAAMRQSAGQDFVFGTSSQLAREQSPTFWRDAISTIRASDRPGEDDTVCDSFAEAGTSECKLQGRNLWSVSARDGDGEVVDVEIIDLVNSPSFSQGEVAALPNPRKNLTAEQLAGSGTEVAGSSRMRFGNRPACLGDVEASELPSRQPHTLESCFSKAGRNPTTISAASALLEASCLQSPCPLVTDLLEEVEAPPPSNQEQIQELTATTSAPTTSTEQLRPKYELFTDAKLAKEVSSYGFKAVKTRTAMITLLDQCWKSKNQTLAAAAASFSTTAVATIPKGKKKADASAMVKTSTPPAPKKSRSKTSKAMTGAKNVEDEVKTADSSSTTSAKKRSKSRTAVASMAGAKSAASSMPPPPKPKSAPSTPKRKRAAKVRATEVPEADMESDLPPNLLTTETSLSSPDGAAIDGSITDDTDVSLDLSPTEGQSMLFVHITNAVLSAPRTTKPNEPSWHEKMLMYDPIILEDLTAWLNSGQLTRVGFDGEVSALDVKKWCESKSICCLWRLTSRGRERKRL